MKKHNQFYLYSDRVYQALPYFYLGAGLLTLFLLRNAMGVFSGLTLVSAAGVVWMLRYQNRRPSIESRSHITASKLPDRPTKEVVGQPLSEVSWNSSFECGNTLIDGQHRKLFGISNELVLTVLSKESKTAVGNLLDELAQQIDDHFCSEEAILARIKYVDYAQHQEQHRSLSAKLADLRGQYSRDQVGAIDLVAFVFYEVIIKHILTQDRNFSDALKAASETAQQ